MYIKDKLYEFQVYLHKKSNKKPKKRLLKQQKRSERIFLTILFIYPIIHFLVFYIGVIANSLLLAFKTFNPVTRGYDFIGLANFKDVFFNLSHDKVLLDSVGRGVIMYLADLLISMPINIFVAYFLYKKVCLPNFFRTVLFIPTLISSIAMVIMFRYFVGIGIPEILRSVFNMPEENIPNFFMDTEIAFPLMIFFGIWTGVAGGMVIYMSSMSRVPDSLIEYGQLEGISLWREFISVILPLIYPTITLFFVTGLTGLFMSSGAVYSFYEDQAPTKLQTLGYYLFTRVIGTNASLQQYPYASAIGIVCAVTTAPIILFSKWFFEKFDPNVEF